MGAVRSFTPTGTLTSLIGGSNDDSTGLVYLPFSFWGYTEARIANNGALLFGPDAVSLGQEYMYGWPLDPSNPGFDYAAYGWFLPNRYQAVGLFPLLTDNQSSSISESWAVPATVEYGTAVINGRQAFLVTWAHQPYYYAGESSPRNTTQAVIYSDDSFELNYDELNWTIRWDWSDYGDSTYWMHATAGWRMVYNPDLSTSINDSVFDFPWSGMLVPRTIGLTYTQVQDPAVIDGSATSVTANSNVGVPGRYAYSTDNAQDIQIPVEVSGDATVDLLYPEGSVDVPVLLSYEPYFLYAEGSVEVLLEASATTLTPITLTDISASGSLDIPVSAEGFLQFSADFRAASLGMSSGDPSPATGLTLAPQDLYATYYTTARSVLRSAVVTPATPESSSDTDPSVATGIRIRPYWGVVLDMETPTLSNGNPS